MLVTDATNLPRLMNCNGSRNMPPSFPTVDMDTTDRDEGNAAHWLAQEWYNARVEPVSVVGQKAYNGVVITGDMVEHVGTYLNELAPGQMEVETSFGNDRYRINARTDHIGTYRSTRDRALVLQVDDFKYGHRLVDPVMNWTLIAHAIGYCIFNQIVPDRIKLRIHQPRPYHPDGKLRTWEITYPELMQLYNRIDTTLTNPSDNLVTGISWCARCRALATCPAARSANMNAIDATTLTFSDTLPSDALSHELDMMEAASAILSARLGALKELATYRLTNGDVIENYATETQLANTRWKSGITPEALSVASGINCVKPGFITPAEYKRRGGSSAVYDALTERPTTGVKLIRQSADQRAKRLLGRKS